MKKLCLAILAATSFLAVTAIAAPTTGYTSKDLLSAKAAVFPPTDITIINASANVIYSSVPGTSYHRLIPPGFNEHLTHPTWFGDTHLVLEDSFGFGFYDAWVCRLAVMTVYAPDFSHVVPDFEYCR